MKTRKFLKERQVDQEELNIKNLVLHASAFGLFAFSVAINEIIYLTYSIIYLSCWNDFCSSTTLVKAELAVDISFTFV